MPFNFYYIYLCWIQFIPVSLTMSVLPTKCVQNVQLAFFKFYIYLHSVYGVRYLERLDHKDTFRITDHLPRDHNFGGHRSALLT